MTLFDCLSWHYLRQSIVTQHCRRWPHHRRIQLLQQQTFKNFTSWNHENKYITVNRVWFYTGTKKECRSFGSRTTQNSHRVQTATKTNLHINSQHHIRCNTLFSTVSNIVDSNWVFITYSHFVHHPRDRSYQRFVGHTSTYWRVIKNI